MFNVQAVVLKQLLTIEDKAAVADAFSCLRKEYFTDAFSSIYVAIQNYFTTKGKMPTLDALRLTASRNVRLAQALAVLDLQHIPDVDIMDSVEVLETEFAQDLTLDLFEREVLTDLHVLDKDTLIDRLNALALAVENEVGHNGIVTQASDIEIFREAGAMNPAVTLGISNEFEIYSGSLQRTEVLLLGGFRGSGKSLVCSNMQVSQYEMGRISPYFSLEMKEVEILMRNLSIMSGVSSQLLRQGKLPPEAVRQLLMTRAKMFNGGLEAFHEYAGKYSINEMSDGFELEKRLREDFEEVTPMPIIYDPSLTIERVEGITRGLINTHGEENVELVILDYVNQVRLSGASDHDMYDWKPQMVVAKSFKSMCGRLNVGGVSPYQMSESGEARMSKGILDSCDIAFKLNTAKKKEADGTISDLGAILFESTKCRSMPEKVFITPIDWKSLRMDASTNYSREDLLLKGLELSLDFDKASKGSSKKSKPKKEESDGVVPGPPAGAMDL